MARSRTAATSQQSSSDEAEIVAWYEDLLERTVPPTDLAWEPVKIGPTWQWENGWLLPERSLGWNRLAWCGLWLRDKHGQPWQFTPEQTRFILWYDALDEGGDFLFHSAVLQRLKGWGKDPVGATLAASDCFAEVRFDHWDGDVPVGREEPNAWVQIVAVSQEQTKNTMKLFPSMISLEARRHYGIQVGKQTVYGLSDTRQIEAVTSNPLSIEGGRPTQIVRNETQNWNESNAGHDMAGAIEGNAAKSEGGAARMLDICNAYRPGEESVGQRVREAFDSTQGEDASQVEYGLLYDSLEAPPEAPLTADAAPSVVASIAGDSSWLDVRPNGRIVKSILNPANPPSESRRKWYNQIVAAEDALVDPFDWDAKAAPSVHVATGESIVMFFDGSKNDDDTGLVGCRLTDGHVFQLGWWGKPPRLTREDARAWVVPRDAVDARVVEVMARYDVRGFWADLSDVRDDDDGERFWQGTVDKWHTDYAAKLDLWAIKTGDRRHSVAWDMRTLTHQQQFTEATMAFVSDVETPGAFTHCGSAKLTAHAKNGRRRPNKYGVAVGKEHRESRKKIDLLVCAIGARMMRRVYLNRSADETDESWEVW